MARAQLIPGLRGWKGGIHYFLRDEYITDRAGGAVNGTAAEPGPGTRTAIETDGQLSISLGAMNFPAQATPAWGDQGLVYNTALARSLGKMVLFKFSLAAAVGCYFSGGFHNAANIVGDSSAFNGAMLRAGNGAFQVEGYTGVVVQITIVALVAATEYKIALVMRATGMYYFVKGGVFSNWSLLWVLSANSQATLYPVITNYNAAITMDSLRVPIAVFIPIPLAYDLFTRADGALGNSETSGPDNQTITARAWADTAGTWAISTNKAVCSALAGGIGIASVDATTRNVLCSAALSRAGNNVGIVASYVDANNYILAYHDGTNAHLEKIVGGVNTSLINAAAAYAAGGVMVLKVDGNSVTLHYNNVRIGGIQTVSDAGLMTGTRCGLYTTNTGNSLDTFQVFPHGNGGEYAALDAYSG